MLLKAVKYALLSVVLLQVSTVHTSELSVLPGGEEVASAGQVLGGPVDFNVIKNIINEDHLKNLATRTERAKRIMEIEGRAQMELRALNAEEEAELARLLTAFENDLSYAALGIDPNVLSLDQQNSLTNLIQRNLEGIFGGF